MSSKNCIKLEVCVDSIASAVAAAEGGAARIELCSALSEGGLTPSVGTLKILKEKCLNIPIFCMLRPRRGNDFIYSTLEIQALLADMDILREQGADGFVFGALTNGQTVNTEQCQYVLQQAAGLPVTFHRAFDLTNPICMDETVSQIRHLGFKRILSSGFCQSAEEGTNNLAKLIAKHHRDIIIMPGAGISVSNLDEILTATKCAEFHASAKKEAGENINITKMDCEISMGKQDIEPYSITDVNVVRKMVAIGRAVTGE
ncbi:copper homeostasis protein cutC homolog [Teleopsis dalmanni]|uniref:copper homeostasis protein cutC homolog n=1 Tax=Teleopsis dalmanni TaxID=139649 RepID=UPI0018CDE787|nr:copper homeostasis protein cutC homolog [Teleopsis dalmanni]